MSNNQQYSPSPEKDKDKDKDKDQDKDEDKDEYCISVEMEAAVVFRFNDPLSDDLATLLQVRT